MSFTKYIFYITVITFTFCLSFPAFADNSGQVQNHTFTTFAKRWVKKLNINHINGISHIKILQNTDGSFLARYHYIDPSSISCSVKSSKSKRSRFVGLLKYIENVYECSAPSKKLALEGKFKVSKAMRVTEIFSNNGKGWR